MPAIYSAIQLAALAPPLYIIVEKTSYLQFDMFQAHLFRYSTSCPPPIIPVYNSRVKAKLGYPRAKTSY